MDLSFTPEDRAFRETVRAFLAEPLPRTLCERVRRGEELDKPARTAWQKALYDRGWAGINWPLEHGGTGWTSVQKHIFWEELCEADAPGISPFGLAMVAPIIMAFGSEAQKQRYLPPILRSDVWWCQGYSEPGAGSDLASLKTRAVRDGDDYVVNGAKTWTTDAHLADWIFCLVRTDSSGRKQGGISFLLIDLKSPGISIRPIVTIDGGHEVNEVFFQDVRVPVENRIGEENKGWTYAKALLTHERTGIAGVAWSKSQLRRLKALAAATDDGFGGRLLDDPALRDRISGLEIQLMALEMTDLRTLASVSAGHAPGPESSILKIRGTEIQQSLTELLLEVAGQRVVAAAKGPDAIARLYLNHRKVTIFGGTSEIQKNIIAKAVLGL
ncbi:MAG: acyl-CoA dehydrogenase family protein [Niveispirillum sp.]|uniref:acyl-CoA dehydrogenase family protein n=1 Tax=Niveispirillum sp. TaxID=1917217 RepID=UPI003BA6C6E0